MALEFPDPTRWLALLADREDRELRRQALAQQQFQNQFNNQMDSERLRIAQADRIDREVQNRIDVRLGELRLKTETQKAELFDRMSGLMGHLQTRLGSPQSAAELEQNMAVAEDTIGGSNVFKPLRGFEGGLDAAIGAVNKGFMSLADGFAAHPDYQQRLALSQIGTNPESRLFKASDDKQREKWRAIPGDILSEWTSEITAIPKPGDIVDPVVGIDPSQFKTTAEGFLGGMAEYENRLALDQRLSTDDSKAEVQELRNAIQTKRVMWQEKVALIDRVEKVRQSIANGAIPTATLSIEKDLGEHYETFARPTIMHAPLPQAIATMAGYAETGFMPSQIEKDLTNPLVFERPDSAYRASALIETYQMQSAKVPKTALVDSLKAQPGVLSLVTRINGWRAANRNMEIVAETTEDPQARLVLQNVNYSTAFVSARDGYEAGLQVAKAASEDASIEARDSAIKIKQGGSGFEVPRESVNVTPRQVSRGVFLAEHKGDFDWEELTGEEQTAILDQFEFFFEQGLVAQNGDISAASVDAKNELEKRWGPNWIGPDMGSGTAPGHPRGLAIEQGIDMEPWLAESYTRMQFEREVLRPYNEKHGTSYTFKDVDAVSVVREGPAGIAMGGYLAKVNGVPLHDGVWHPDFRDSLLWTQYGDTEDGMRIQKHYQKQAVQGWRDMKERARSEFHHKMIEMDLDVHRAKRRFVETRSDEDLRRWIELQDAFDAFPKTDEAKEMKMRAKHPVIGPPPPGAE